MKNIKLIILTFSLLMVLVGCASHKMTDNSASSNNDEKIKKQITKRVDGYVYQFNGKIYLISGDNVPNFSTVKDIDLFFNTARTIVNPGKIDNSDVTISKLSGLKSLDVNKAISRYSIEYSVNTTSPAISTRLNFDSTQKNFD